MKKDNKAAKVAKGSNVEAIVSGAATYCAAIHGEATDKRREIESDAKGRIRERIVKLIDEVRAARPDLKPRDVAQAIREGFTERDKEGNVVKGPNGPKYVIPSSTLSWAMDGYIESPTNVKGDGVPGAWAAEKKDLKLRVHAKDKREASESAARRIIDKLNELTSDDLREVANAAASILAERQKTTK